MKLTDGEQIEPYTEEKTRDIFRQLLLGELFARRCANLQWETDPLSNLIKVSLICITTRSYIEISSLIVSSRSSTRSGNRTH